MNIGSSILLLFVFITILLNISIHFIVLSQIILNIHRVEKTYIEIISNLICFIYQYKLELHNSNVEYLIQQSTVL